MCSGSKAYRVCALFVGGEVEVQGLRPVGLVLLGGSVRRPMGGLRSELEETSETPGSLGQTKMSLPGTHLYKTETGKAQSQVCIPNPVDAEQSSWIRSMEVHMCILGFLIG